MSGIPRLSVIIPHLNEPDDLCTCLLALDRQRSEAIPFEIIVVDNGSAELPHFVTSLVSGVRLEQEPIPGPGPARNHGASVARAELLAFIDADCIADPGWVAAIVEFMAGNPSVDFVGGDIRIRQADPDRMTSVEAYEHVYSYRTQTYVERDGYAATGNMAVRANVFLAVGPFGGISTMEDTEWGKRASAQGYRIAYLSNARVTTPSCRSFAELTRRWDRHVAHEFRHVRGDPGGLLKWLAKSAIVAISPLGDVVKILRSDRVSSMRERWLAFTCLTRIRLYRSRRMIGLAWRDNTAAMVDSWNRESP